MMTISMQLESQLIKYYHYLQFIIEAWIELQELTDDDPVLNTPAKIRSRQCLVNQVETQTHIMERDIIRQMAAAHIRPNKKVAVNLDNGVEMIFWYDEYDALFYHGPALRPQPRKPKLPKYQYN